jgi:glyoxylase-like metal-dependent hydrolase (beta-lactamase superfamily II)
VTLRAETVEPGIVRLRMRSWAGAVAGYESSAYLLHGVLVDSGLAHAQGGLLAAARALAPRGVVVTHSHEDHAGNAAALAAGGMPIRMHPRCEAVLRDRPPIRAYRRLVWGRPARLAGPLLDFDPAPLQVIALPGHTTDHQVVWDAERRVLVSGDLYLGVKVRVAHASESPRALVASLRAAAALEPRILLDAHRGVVADAAGRLRAKVAWLQETIGAIEALAASGIGPREIRRRVLGREAAVGWASGGEYSKLAFVLAVLGEGRN